MGRAMGSAASDVELTVRCLCGQHNFGARISRTSLPLRAIYCHCHSCRHVTGALYSSDVPWSGDGDAIRASTLRRYAHSPRLGLLFCGTCSSKLFFEHCEEGKPSGYGALSGAVPDINVSELVKITDHIFLADTEDGGASGWLCHTNSDRSLPRLWAGAKEASERFLCRSVASNATSLDADETPIRCRCGGVDFVLRRAEAEYAITPRSELPWFIDPVTHKPLANFDACNSCRLSSGADVFNWTYALLRHVRFAGSAVQGRATFPDTTAALRAALLDSRGENDSCWGTLAVYESSPGVQRYFCSRCSACVFYATDSRPDMVRVAIGVLESPQGARAEGLVSWQPGKDDHWRPDSLGSWRDELVKDVEDRSMRQ
ncbi:hypothetical protein F4780DRAFT_767944 [Xylariomycetidae sp. FL0641]|nr:hypothetical protein F4780DRAFT_767944 [Xylariomycetidae sp. FL0641]